MSTLDLPYWILHLTLNRYHSLIFTKIQNFVFVGLLSIPLSTGDISTFQF